ncbi:uncharacterized protein LOC128883429 isoform X2 [Hylaeus volcanicus]|uniref:uncharacterized protein LOC128883429 isoform X2 n=1 Tax=Hylaeus volcanicus TaxID=313075 RepID=UPI0023B7DE48|nr:uncharacterized protein LOC128883429 isoform X2 [Hylaeus volcanicus]
MCYKEACERLQKRNREKRNAPNTRWKPVDIDFEKFNIEDCCLLEELETDGASSNQSDTPLQENDPLKQNAKRTKFRSKKLKHETLNQWSDNEKRIKTKSIIKDRIATELSLTSSSIQETKKKSFDSLFNQQPLLKEVNDTMSSWLMVLPTIPSLIIKALYEQGFKSPTPIQSRVLVNAVRKYHDIVGAAQTGSGKTLAFGLPILIHLVESYTARLTHAKSLPENFDTLIVVPSRELATQVFHHLNAINTFLPFKIVCLIGGISWQKQWRQLETLKPQIVVGTPGRLCVLSGSYRYAGAKEHTSHHEGNNVPVSPFLAEMSDVRHLVLDEADRVVEDGHFQELTYILQHLYDSLKNRHDRLQTFIFSATLSVGSFRNETQRSELVSKSDDTYQNSFLLSEAFRNRIKLKQKALTVIDLTLSNCNAFTTPTCNSSNRQCLPSKIGFSAIRCLEDEREFQLYLFLTHFIREKKMQCKIIVFVNAISYVYRLVSLMSLLFGSHPAFMFHPTTHYSDKNHATHHSAVPHDTQCNSEGTRVLMEFLNSKFKSRSSETSFEEFHPGGLLRKKHVADKKSSSHSLVSVLGLHSRVKQGDRLKRFEKFQANLSTSILFCTDVAARGLDIPNVDMIVHLQLPRSFSLFVHRSGRTARAKQSGQCCCFCVHQESQEWGRIFDTMGLSLDRVKPPSCLEGIVPTARNEYKARFDLATKIDQLYRKKPIFMH